MKYSITITDKEQTFIDAYIEAIYFTDTGDLDKPNEDSELDPDFLRKSIIDCLAFYNQVRWYIPDESISQAGHDFWLTRNDHGTGFWDRKEVYGKYSQMFTELSKQFGEVESVFDELIEIQILKEKLQGITDNE
jgi:hypothetical protein